MREELSDGRVNIKKIKTEHIQPLFQLAYDSKEEIKIWLPWCHSEYKIEETSGWVNFCEFAWESKTEFNFGIFDSETNEFIGGCGLNQINWLHKIANLGYWIGTRFTGKGFASSAAKLCAEFGFEELKLNRIEIVAAEKNIASQKVAKKAGATKECLARKRLVVGENIHNAFVYSLVKEDIK